MTKKQGNGVLLLITSAMLAGATFVAWKAPDASFFSLIIGTTTIVIFLASSERLP